MIAQRACVLPLENEYRPLNRQPPATRSAPVRGASEDDASACGSSPHTSICACNGNEASSHWCSPSTA